MKIFRTDQIRELDDYTIKNEPVSSVALMERAAGGVFEWFRGKFDQSHPVIIFAGPGNNGGDGLVVARLLYSIKYRVEVFLITPSGNSSHEWKINHDRLLEETEVPVKTIVDARQIPDPAAGSVIIDALFGSGLTRKIEGLACDVITRINHSNAAIVSIDIPSGLFGEDNSGNNTDSIVKANFTLTFQFPKLSFMFPENHQFTGEWIVVPIGLHPEAIDLRTTPYHYVEKELVKGYLKKRKKFDHKGNFGHGLLIGGSHGKMGAVLLGSRAALRTGIGLITCHIPSAGDAILQCSVPEAMVIYDNSRDKITGTGDLSRFSAVGIGPGIGMDPLTKKALGKLLDTCSLPMVIDADALNIISENKKMLTVMRPGSILTPHPKEFERLTGKSPDSYVRLQKQISFSKQHNCIIVLKGANTSITSPSGDIYFNSTGNPGMATAGAGDVLTGMILSLLSQGYEPVNAAITGVYLHGLAGDIAAEKTAEESLTASDIIEGISGAYHRIKGK